MLTLTLVMAVVVVLCLVLREAEDEDMMEGGWTPIKTHGQGLKDHGKQLQEKAAGGKKCPHCGKPI